MNDHLIDEAAQRLEQRVPAATSLDSGFRVSFEYFPPATDASFDSLASSAVALGQFDPIFASVTYGAGGSSQEKTFAALDTLVSSNDVPVAGHLTCVCSSADEVHGVIDQYRDRGVTRIVALRGDVPADPTCCDGSGIHPSGLSSAADLVGAIRSRPDGADFDISVAAYPEVHPKAASPAADMDNLKRKIDAGADRAITQFFFDTDVFLRFLEDARKAGITAPIVPGIMPITNFAGVSRFSDRCGTSIPDGLRGLFDGLDDTPEIRNLVAATVAAEQCKRLAEHGVRDLHFYTMNKPNLTAATCRILGINPRTKSAAASTHSVAS